MKKALFFVNSLSSGGAERVVASLANRMVESGYQVDIILLNEREKDKYALNSNITIYDLKITGGGIRRVFSAVLYVRKINSIIKKNETDSPYDIITSHLPLSNVLTRISCVGRRAIYVFHAPLKYYDRFKLKIIYRILLRIMFENRKIVAVSDGVRKEAIERYGFKTKYIRTIYNPLDIQIVSKMAQEPVNFSGRYFLNVGRFSEVKRQMLALDVFYKGGFYNKYSLVFCGEGEMKEETKRRANEYGISDKVYFLGWQQNVYKWMRHAEILISTSSYESFAMAVLEALVCGTKVVSSDCDFGPREIMNGEYKNYLVKSENVADYIEKINDALKSYPNSRIALIEKCNPNKVIRQYQNYMEL